MGVTSTLCFLIVWAMLITCSAAGWIERNIHCYVDTKEDRGKYFRGTNSTTVSGRKCQRWDSMVPNSHAMTPETRNRKGYDLKDNLCRNPEQAMPDGPWCYNGEGTSPRYESCGLPICVVDTTNSALPSSRYRTKILKYPQTEKSASPYSTAVSAEFFFTGWGKEKFTGETTASETYRPTFSPTLPDPTSEMKGMNFWRHKAHLTGFQRGFFLTFHMINLVMTALVNLAVIYIVLTRVNMIKNPAVIPLLTAAVFALFNVVANYGLFFGMYMQNQYLYQFHERLCGFTDAAMEKVAVLQILCYSILTLEATHAMLNPSTYNRSSRKTFVSILAATLLVIIYVAVTTYQYFTWLDPPDLLTRWIEINGETEGIKLYRWLVIEEKRTFVSYRIFEHCYRYNVVGSWDNLLYVISGLAPCFFGSSTMIYSFIQAYRPGRQKRNFIDAVSGKHKFTPADLEEAVAAAKSIALTTMLSSIFPAAEYAHTFLRTVYPKFPNVMKQILGFQEFYWWIELLRRMAALTAWLPALVSLFLNPIVAKARKGKRDFGKPIFESWIEKLRVCRKSNREVASTGGDASGLV